MIGVPWQVSTSKFHAWNFRFGATKHLWTLLKMLLEFRQTHEANKMEVANDEVQEDPTEHQQTSDDILQRIEKLQKGANSIQIALSVLSDTHLRQISYMNLAMN